MFFHESSLPPLDRDFASGMPTKPARNAEESGSIGLFCGRKSGTGNNQTPPERKCQPTGHYPKMLVPKQAAEYGWVRDINGAVILPVPASIIVIELADGEVTTNVGPQ